MTENTFVFAGFSEITDDASVAMLVIGILAIIACIIFFKKDDVVVYNTLDKIGIILNFVDGFIALPLFSIAAWVIQAFPTGPDWVYQCYYYEPIIIALSLAASIALRRKGFSKLGFIIQFVGPVTFFITGALEWI